MDKEITQRFVEYLQGKFGQRVQLDATATDVLRQPLFPGLDGRPKALNEPGMEEMFMPEYQAGMDLLPGESELM